MKPIYEMTQAEIGAFVQTQLRRSNIDLVLSGGSAVLLYSEGQYVSYDLDLINVNSVKRQIIRKAMQEIGFEEEGRHFKHPDSAFFIEFPDGPLTVGSESVKQINEIPLSTGFLRIISPTDCIKDRLAAYYHWGDLQCLSQAILVAQNEEIDYSEIKRWSDIEGKLDEFIKIIVKFPRSTINHQEK